MSRGQMYELRIFSVVYHCTVRKRVPERTEFPSKFYVVLVSKVFDQNRCVCRNYLPEVRRNSLISVQLQRCIVIVNCHINIIEVSTVHGQTVRQRSPTINDYDSGRRSVTRIFIVNCCPSVTCQNSDNSDNIYLSICFWTNNSI
jgi:hypothetical protein